MQHARSTTATRSIRRLSVALGAVLVLAACGSTTDSSPESAADEVPSVDPTSTIAPTTVAPPSTTATTAAAPTTVPEPVPTTEPAPTVPSTVAPAAPTTSPPTTEPVPVAPCGEFGPIPPRPDSMPTVLIDTDADGDTDEVTAYGAADGWRVRVVEDGVTSEALVDSIAGWAYLADAVPGDSGTTIVLVDNDTDEQWYFATDATGCIAAATPPATVDQLAAPDVADDEPAEDELICGPLPDIPGDAIMGDPFWFDLNGDGVVDDLLVPYFADGVWTLRSELQTWEGGPIAQSEIELPGADPHGVKVIGFADIDSTYGGDEVLVKVGGGASSVEIGFFTWLEGGCLIQYQSDVEAAPFTTSVGATTGHGAGMICGDGYILRWGWMLEDDDTYSAYEAAFEGVALGTLGYMPASDWFGEGLTQDELPDELFDCNGLTL